MSCCTDRQEYARAVGGRPCTAAGSEGISSSLWSHLGPPTHVYEYQPNPTRGATSIRFAVPRKTVVTISLFDVRGRQVRSLTQREWEPGEHAIEWNGRDEDGRRLSAGIYLCRMVAGPYRATRKLAVVP